ncbi:hypothetical protein [Streptomyces caniscabiei]|uniref:hypothetical protein n=1 Tax=Streptomyces caniscabiei TaxID=2746961 RepID=UPI0038F79EE2
MAITLLIAGLAVIGLGIVWMFLPRNKREDVEPHGLDVSDILEKINNMLDKFESRYRPGVIMLVVGVALVCLSVFVETREAKDAVTAAHTVTSVR